MSQTERTTITISKETKSRLTVIANYGDSMDCVIQRLLDCWDKVVVEYD